MVVGEGNKEQLIEFVGCGLEVYKDIIDHRPLPISVGETAAPSGLLYPTKVLVQDDELVISDAGHHRLLICSLDGHVKVGLSYFFFCGFLLLVSLILVVLSYMQFPIVLDSGGIWKIGYVEW